MEKGEGRMENVKLKGINYLIKKSYPHLNY